MKTVLYYADQAGRIPVLEYLDRLSESERVKCLEYISFLEIAGEKIRRPIGDYLGGKLYELRPKQSRIIYFFMFKESVVLVHAFRKKTDAIPERELGKAIVRMNDFIVRCTKNGVVIQP